jgi:phosphohistidine phosphatase
MPSQKTLYILRHAKAKEGVAGQDDHARELNERGVGAAKAMGAHLRKSGIHPDKVLCSSSARTTETLMKMEEGTREPMPIEYSEKLYLASANALLTVIAGMGEDVSSLMLIGHNPGMHQLAVKLAGHGNPKQIEKLVEKFPTGALAEIDFGKIEWRDVLITRGELRQFVTPKMLGT